MITLLAVCARVDGLAPGELERWVELDWVRPGREAGAPAFAEVDVARVRLIVELRRAMEVDESAMPVVLGLLDQLYDERRRMRRLVEVIERAGLGDGVRDGMLRP